MNDRITLGHDLLELEELEPEDLDAQYPPSPPPVEPADYAGAHAADAAAEGLVCRWCGGQLGEGLSLTGARRCLVCGKGTRAIDLEPPPGAVEAVCALPLECGGTCALPACHEPPCACSGGEDCPA